MWKILEIYGIPRKFVSIIQSMYDGSESSVRVGKDNTEWLYVATRIIQGDILSPLLFNILLDFILRKIDAIECGIEWTGGKRLRNLDYADDICLLASDIEEMQMMVDTFVMEGEKIGLKINSAKNRSNENQNAEHSVREYWQLQPQGSEQLHISWISHE